MKDFWGWPRLAVSGLVALLASCGAEEPLRGTYVQVETTGSGLGSGEGPSILFINPCRGGCFIEPGREDARTNRSSIVAWPSRIEEFPWEDHVWAETMRCVRRLYAPFDVIVTDVDPGNVPHSENVVGGLPGDIGQPSFVGGIAPLACGGLENAISFTFAQAIGREVESLCHTIGQETAHSFGLDHQLLCSDPMTYLPACGEKAFQRIDALCGEELRRPCICGQEFQNSHLALLEVLGPRSTPLLEPPFVRIHDPDGDAPVYPEFRIFAEALDDRGITSVELLIDGRRIGSSTVAPHVFIAPASLELGEHELLARATDVEGSTAEDRQTITLIPAPPRRDAGFTDRGPRSEPEPLWWPDAGVEAAAEPEVIDASCGCTAVPARGRASLLPLLAALGFVFCRRRGWALLLALFFTACDDGATLGVSSGKLVMEPPPGTLLAFAPLTLGKDAPEPIILVAKNEGTGALVLSEARLEGPGARAFSVPIRPKTIAAQDDREIFLEMVPGAPIEAGATLILRSNDPELPEVRYPVSGVVREPCRLYASADWLTFAIGQTHELKLTAIGTSACTLVRLGLDRRHFELLEEPELPRTLQPGESLTLHVQHTERTTRAGRPVRALQIEETEGTEVVVHLEGAPPVWNCLQVFPPLVRFGDADFGTEPRARVLVSNTCPHETFDIVSASTDGGAFEAEPLGLPVQVAPGGSASVWIRYQPDDEAGDQSALIIRTTDAVSPFSRVPLEGRARVGRAVMVPAVDFGAVVYRGPPGADGRSRCVSRSRRVPLLSAGSGTLLVDRVELTGDRGFELIGAEVDGVLLDASQPFEVPAGAHAALLVELWPTRPEAAHQARLTVHHRSRDGAPVATLLHGRSVRDEPRVERFTEPASVPVDLLWVVDDSASMAVPQRRLADATPELWRTLAGRSVQTVVVGTDGSWPDGGWPNRCLPNRAVLRSADGDEATLSRALSCAFHVGQASRAPASGTAAALRTIEHALAPAATDGTLNPLSGFLRTEARLAVVIASDEEDQSRERTGSAVAFLRALKGVDRPDLLEVHTISGGEDRAHCLATSPWVQDAVRYRALAGATGGEAHDLCAPDYRGFLASIGDRAAASAAVYPLAAAADPATVRVTVDGAEVLPDVLDGFSYDPDVNLVRLAGASEPRPGASIEISYQSECRP